LAAQADLPKRTKNPTKRPYIDNKGPEGLRIVGEPSKPESEQGVGISLAHPVPIQDSEDKESPVKILPPKPLPPPKNLFSEVGNLRKQDDRFAAIQFRVENGIVYLHTEPQDAEDLFDFAQQISHLPGVRRVIIERLSKP
jgi:hypothetical protein